MSEEEVTERSLVEKFFNLGKKRRELDAVLKTINKEFKEVAMRLSEILNAQEKSATATYEGIGYVSLSKPRVSASCAGENKERLFEFLNSVDRGDIIKTDVNARTLTTFVKEVLENPEMGIELPDYINLNFFPDVNMYDGNGKKIAGTSMKPESEE